MNNIKYLNSNTNFIGLLTGFGGYTLFVLLDSIIKKYLVNDYSVFQINFFICFFSFIPTCLFLHFYSGWRVLINNTIHIQLLRGVFGVVGGAFVVNSFINHSFSEIYPILFSAPLILCVMSFFFLKEKVGYNRWAAVLIGFYWSINCIETRYYSFYFKFIRFVCFSILNVNFCNFNKEIWK